MNCLINLLAVCVFDPSNVSITGEIDFTPPPRRFDNGLYEGRWCEDRFCTGPVGTLRIGVDVALPKGWHLNYGIKHTSTVSTARDRGAEYPYLSLTWRPFR